MHVYDEISQCSHAEALDLFIKTPSFLARYLWVAPPELSFSQGGHPGLHPHDEVTAQPLRESWVLGLESCCSSGLSEAV